MSLIKGDQSLVRTHNRRLVLDHLRVHGPVSRIELARATGLSGAAVTQVTGTLLEEGFLVEKTGAGGGVGRRPVPLDINYGGFFAVGVKLTAHYLQAVLTDLSTRVVGQVTLDVANRPEPDGVADRLGQAVRDLMSGRGLSARQVVGVGVGLSGVVDARRGVAVLSPRLGWREVPFARLVAERAGVPTWIDNDSNAFAAAQALFGHGRGTRDLVVVIVGPGVGAGLMLGGELYHGAGGGAGEIGHTLSEPGGAPCSCGRRGCVEAYASEDGLLARLAELRPDLGVLDPRDLPRLAAQGQTEVLELLRDGGARLGRCLGQLVNVLNPELLVIGGEGTRLGEAYFGAVRRELLTHASPPLAASLRVVTEAWGDDLWARGAASLAIRHAFLNAALPDA